MLQNYFLLFIFCDKPLIIVHICLIWTSLKWLPQQTVVLPSYVGMRHSSDTSLSFCTWKILWKICELFVENVQMCQKFLKYSLVSVIIKVNNYPFKNTVTFKYETAFETSHWGDSSGRGKILMSWKYVHFWAVSVVKKPAL